MSESHFGDKLATPSINPFIRKNAAVHTAHHFWRLDPTVNVTLPLLSILVSLLSRMDNSGNITFTVGSNREMVCTAAFLRIKGLMLGVNASEAPGQFSRLLKGHLTGLTRDEMLSEEKTKLDASERFLRVRGFQKSFISSYALHYADTIPTVKSENGKVDIKVVPFRTTKADFWQEFELACVAQSIPKSEYGSYETFKRAFDEMRKEDQVQLLGGKGSFNTCAICNNALAIKKAAAARHDRVSIEIVRKIHRLHVQQQQQNERQNCENQIWLAKSWFVDDNPALAYIGIDGQTNEATKAAKLFKGRNHNFPTMENRNLGVRMVCGPIDEYMSICTSNLIPGGCKCFD